MLLPSLYQEDMLVLRSSTSHGSQNWTKRRNPKCSTENKTQSDRLRATACVMFGNPPSVFSASVPSLFIVDICWSCWYIRSCVAFAAGLLDCCLQLWVWVSCFLRFLFLVSVEAVGTPYSSCYCCWLLWLIVISRLLLYLGIFFSVAGMGVCWHCCQIRFCAIPPVDFLDWLQTPGCHCIWVSCFLPSSPLLGVCWIMFVHQILHGNLVGFFGWLQSFGCLLVSSLNFLWELLADSILRSPSRLNISLSAFPVFVGVCWSCWYERLLTLCDVCFYGQNSAWVSWWQVVGLVCPYQTQN